MEDASNADTAVPRNAVRAWLAAADAGDGPGAAQADAPRAQLVALRRRARARLQRHVLAAAVLLERHLRREGLGCRLDRAALDTLDTPSGSDAYDGPADSVAVELLRLLGPCLARPRRADPRGSVVADFLAQGRRGSGRLRLPAGPAALELRASRAGWHLAAEPLAPGTPAGRVLTALGRTSLYC